MADQTPAITEVEETPVDPVAALTARVDALETYVLTLAAKMPRATVAAPVDVHCKSNRYINEEKKKGVFFCALESGHAPPCDFSREKGK